MTNEPRDQANDPQPPPSAEEQPLVDLLRDQAAQFPDPLAIPGQIQRSAEEVVHRAKKVTDEQLAAHVMADEQSNEVHAAAPRSGRRRRDWAVGTVLAIGLIVTVAVWLVLNPPGGRAGESVAVKVEVTAAGVRSGDTVPTVLGTERVYQLTPGSTYALTITCPRDGVATIVRITAGGVDIFPKQGQIEVSAGQATSYESLRFSDQPVTLLVLVAATPATDTIREVVNSTDPPPPAFRDRLLDRLWSAGHRWAAVDVITIEPFEE